MRVNKIMSLNNILFRKEARLGKEMQFGKEVRHPEHREGSPCYQEMSRKARHDVLLWKSNKRGFTLIELLIVIVIIGIVSTAAIYSFGDFGASRQAKITAEQFSTYIKLLQQQAILETRTFGIKMTPAAYEIYQLNTRARWQEIGRAHV